MKYALLLTVLAFAFAGCDSNDARHSEEGFAAPDKPVVHINPVGMVFARIPAGTFVMGSHNGQADERPVHTVTISRDFFMGMYEVTQAQWKTVMGDNPSWFTGDDHHPVERVSWLEVQV